MSRYNNILLFALLIICTAVYWPGLDGDYIYDDFSSLIYASAFTDTETVTLTRVISENTSGPGQRPISMASFYLSYKYAGGFDARSFKAANLSIHLLNGILLYLLVTRLFRASQRNDGATSLYALVVTAIWLLHPLHVSTVMYVVQRMTLLSTTFMLTGLLTYAIGRYRLTYQRSYGVIFLSISLLCMILAFFSKEIGALQGLLALTLEVLLFNKAWPTNYKLPVRAYFLTTVYLPLSILIIGIFTGFSGRYLNYDGRPFTLLERLLTESRVLVDYIRWIVVPDIQQYALYHDDIALSTNLLSPPTTLLSIITITLFALAIIKLQPRRPLIATGLALFFVGHSLESTILPLLLAFEHRNYLPSAGIIIALIAGLAPFWHENRYRLLSLIFLPALLLILSFATFTRSMNWGNPLAHALSEVATHPDSPLAHSQASTVYNAIASSSSLEADDVAKYATYAFEHLTKASILDPESSIYRIGLIWIQSEYLSKPPTKRALDNLSNYLLGMTPEPAVGWHIQSLVECGVISKRCAIDPQDLRNVVNSALANPKISGSNRTSTLLGLAVLDNFEGNFNKAMYALNNAINAAHNKMPLRLALANYMLDIGYMDDYESLLEDIHNDTRAWAYQKDIRLLDKKLQLIR